MSDLGAHPPIATVSEKRRRRLIASSCVAPRLRLLRSTGGVLLSLHRPRLSQSAEFKSLVIQVFSSGTGGQKKGQFQNKGKLNPCRRPPGESGVGKVHHDLTWSDANDDGRKPAVSRMEPRSARPPSVGARARPDRTAQRSSDLVARACRRARRSECGLRGAECGTQFRVGTRGRSDARVRVDRRL